ncbi:MAG: hypothetical protein ACK4E4_05990 [Rhodocyclaceae bacterium]
MSPDRLLFERTAGFALVLSLHAAALWGLWQHRLIPNPPEAMTLFVDFIAPPAPEKKEEPQRPPTPKPIARSRPPMPARAAPAWTAQPLLLPGR